MPLKLLAETGDAGAGFGWSTCARVCQSPARDPWLSGSGPHTSSFSITGALSGKNAGPIRPTAPEATSPRGPRGLTCTQNRRSTGLDEWCPHGGPSRTSISWEAEENQIPGPQDPGSSRAPLPPGVMLRFGNVWSGSRRGPLQTNFLGIT